MYTINLNDQTDVLINYFIMLLTWKKITMTKFKISFPVILYFPLYFFFFFAVYYYNILFNRGFEGYKIIL